MRYLVLPVLCLLSTELFAASAFEKPVLWSARAAQRGGAYTAEVAGADALVFNPAGIIQDKKKELAAGLSAAFSNNSAATVTDNDEQSQFNGPVTPIAVTYAYQLDEKNAIAFGTYSVGGVNIGFDNVNLSDLGSEFSSFRPDIYARVSIQEFGFGFAHQYDQNFSFGAALRGQYTFGGFGETQITRAQGLGPGVPDGTVLAVSQAEFKKFQGLSGGSFTLGMKYLSTDKKTGFGLNYRSLATLKMRSEASGKIVFSNTGAAATGATAGQIYKMNGSYSNLTTSLPQAITASLFRKFSQTSTFYFEYTWTQYSHNRNLKIDGKMTDPSGATNSIPNHIFKWHDMHDFKLGLTNTSIENWILGGGYSLTLPVTDKKNAGASNAAPGTFHHFYTGAGRLFKNFRVDGALEYYMGSGKGQSTGLSTGANQVVEPIKGTSRTDAFALILSSSYYF